MGEMVDFTLSRGPDAWVPEADGFLVFGDMAPASAAHERMEAALAASLIGVRALTPAEVPEHIMAAAADEPQGELVVVDPVILALMRLAEYYMVTEGDIRQALQATVDVGIRDLRVQHPDRGVRREYERIADELDLLGIARAAWFTSAVYGAAWPFELWSGGARGTLRGAEPSVTLLNPKHVAPARGLTVTRAVYYNPSRDTLSDILANAASPAFYNSLSHDWNEPAQLARGIRLDPEFVYRVADEWFMHAVFPVPMIAGAQRSLSTRQILEEMIRATIEGVKTQLWIFSLKEPRKGEVTALKALLEGERGTRTGYLVWSDNLTVQQYIPQSIDRLLANETWQRMTHAVFRSLGLFMRVASGETPTVGGGQRGDAELDITIWVDRMNAPRQRVQRWLDRFARHCAEALGMKPEEAARLRLNPVNLSVRGAIRDRLQPLLNFGLPSIRTGMEMAGLDPDLEIENMRREQEDGTRDLVRPYAGFAQMTRGGAKVESPLSQGRPAGMPETPDDANNPAFASRREYADEVDAAFDLLLRDGDVPSFIMRVREINARQREEAYREGYRTHGGYGEPDAVRIAATVGWDAPNLDAFAGKLETAEERGGMRYRARLYAQEGWKRAYMMGMWQAKREQGWTAWRRIVRANACSLCREDARVIHPMDEEFFDLHPNGECGFEHVQFFAGVRVSAPQRIPYFIQGE